MTLSKLELEKRISVLERKAIREKKARQLAENQLEKYSADIYEANQSLQRALASSTQKQLELEYLSKASSGVASDLSLNRMISNMLELTGEFCSATYGFFIVSKNGMELNNDANDVWCLEQGWQPNSQLHLKAISHLPIPDSTILESWEISNELIPPAENSKLINSAIYTNFCLEDDKVCWLLLLNDKINFNKELVPLLNTAREYLLGGISKRLSDTRILKRNAQLQDSLNKLEKARRQLIQSEKMASLGQLAAGVAHEINNPIAFIRSNMEVLQDYVIDYKQLNTEIKASLAENGSLDGAQFNLICQKIELDYIEEDSEDLLKSNIEGLDRVREIVDNLKGFSHSGDEALVEMSLMDCIEAALKIAGNMFKYQHKIDNRMSKTCPLVMGNAGQLQQVFVNLFVNAAHAMESGGVLTIDFTATVESVVIHIKDTGSGMDQETVSQLFTPFFTTKPVGIGTGLGLSVSYAILEAHGAQVTVNSKLNVGTTFNVIFPAIS